MYNDYEIVHTSHAINYFWVYTLIGLAVIIVILFFYSLSKVFKKASINEVYAYVPFLNLYKILEICGLSKINMILIFIPFINLYTLYMISKYISECFNMNDNFKYILMFLPIYGYPKLGLTNEKYVGINNKRVKSIMIEELKHEEHDEVNVSEVLKKDINVGMGTNLNINKESEDNNDNELVIDTSILNQETKKEETYKECPNCHNKIKESTNICFMCGYKFN